MRYHDLSRRDNIKFEMGGTLAAAPGDMREAGATTLILYLRLLMQRPDRCPSSTILVDFADVPT
jgi:hypothetical protein